MGRTGPLSCLANLHASGCKEEKVVYIEITLLQGGPAVSISNLQCTLAFPGKK